VFSGFYGSGVGRVVEEIGKRVRKDKELAKEIEEIRKNIKKSCAQQNKVYSHGPARMF
jgi:hypothetical protein